MERGARTGLTRGRALLLLSLVTLAGGVLRFVGIGWGAPYFHFHMDEHYVFMGADLLRKSMRDAAMSGKFFMYGPLAMYGLNVVRSVYESVSHELVLTVFDDQVTYMRMGRAISAAFSTATIVLVYAIAARVAGRLAGLLSAACLAVTVLHVRDAHFFSVDMTLTFFCVLTWLCALRMAERGTALWSVLTGSAFALALTAKYSAAFLAIPIALAHLLSPARPSALRAWASWRRWVLLGALMVAVTIATFLVVDPMVVAYYDKFREDVRQQITDPLTGTTRPMYMAHFSDLTHPRVFWFTNLLWWGMGPALEIWALAGVIWLLVRRNKAALVSAVVPLAYFTVAGNSVAPFIRYAIPMATALSVAAGVLSADLIARRRWRPLAIAATAAVIGTSALWAVAYTHIFRTPDTRLVASRWIMRNIPRGAPVLVEPSHNIPPTGSHLTNVDFYGNYVLFYPETERRDHFRLIALDTYRSLYNRGPTDEWRREYIASRLQLADWIVMDDTYVQWFTHLPAPEYAVMKQYYRDLFGGRLGFELVRTFKTHPSLFGYEIDDDASEFSFRLFDHPRIWVFKRTGDAR
ncbi:MAG: glycosyltransferase family 39 protein [Acidobacteria bacterium]|nr:glycosyltransferase family 39 protein [Acidobacteriota bacterium]